MARLRIRWTAAMLCYVIALAFLTSFADLSSSLSDTSDQAKTRHFRGQDKTDRETPRPVVVVLSTSEEDDLRDLQKSIGFLARNVPRCTAPLYVFHEGDITSGLQHEIARSAQSSGYAGSVSFYTVRLSPPDGCCSFEPNWTKRKELFGYHNMIRFWIKDVWHHHAIVDGDFNSLMRLDTDSYITSRQLDNDTMPALPWPLLYRGNVHNYDRMPVIDGFADFMKTIVKMWPHPPRNPELMSSILSTYEETGSIMGIYNNFFIASPQFFRRRHVVQVVNLICCTPPYFYLYRYRWGDAIVHLFLLALEADKSEFVVQPPLGYVHGNE